MGATLVKSRSPRTLLPERLRRPDLYNNTEVNSSTLLPERQTEHLQGALSLHPERLKAQCSTTPGPIQRTPPYTGNLESRSLPTRSSYIDMTAFGVSSDLPIVISICLLSRRRELITQVNAIHQRKRREEQKQLRPEPLKRNTYPSPWATTCIISVMCC